MLFPIADENIGRRTTPVVNYLLILINVLVFVFLQGFGTNERFTYAFSTVPAAISGVLGAYILLFPTNRVIVLLGWFAMPMPAFIAIGLWFVFQLISGLGVLGSGSQQGGVAYAAHIGGFIAGLILINIFQIGRPRTSY